MKRQLQHDVELKLPIRCNKKKSRFYSKTEIFAKVVGACVVVVIDFYLFLTQSFTSSHKISNMII